uniref:Lyase n=1 Tax=Burkholderia pseudomallei TaxID=28450 RepID=Q52502_BURPE|nr:lyase [Burkholderia pseudomallei]prf//2107161B glpB gene [Burkholderia pseudomallei]
MMRLGRRVEGTPDPEPGIVLSGVHKSRRGRPPQKAAYLARWKYSPIVAADPRAPQHSWGNSRVDADRERGSTKTRNPNSREEVVICMSKSWNVNHEPRILNSQFARKSLNAAKPSHRELREVGVRHTHDWRLWVGRRHSVPRPTLTTFWASLQAEPTFSLTPRFPLHHAHSFEVFIRYHEHYIIVKLATTRSSSRKQPSIAAASCSEDRHHAVYAVEDPTRPVRPFWSYTLYPRTQVCQRGVSEPFFVLSRLNVDHRLIIHTGGSFDITQSHSYPLELLEMTTCQWAASLRRRAAAYRRRHWSGDLARC